MEYAMFYTIGELIKKNRKNAKKTQAEVAKCVGVSTVSYQRYEYDKVIPSIEKVEEIAAAIGMDMISFFLYDGEFPIYRSDVENKGGWRNDEYTYDLLIMEYKRCCKNAIDGSGKFKESDLGSDMLIDFQRLNIVGKKEALKRVKEMTQLPQYAITEESEEPEKGEKPEKPEKGEKPE